MKPRRNRERSRVRSAPPVATGTAPDSPPSTSRIDAVTSPIVRVVAAALLLALALSALFPEIAWQGRIFASPDFEAPSDLASAGYRALAEGEYPLWNPYIFLGMPSFGSLSFNPYVFPISEVLRAVGSLPGAPPLGWLLFYFWLAGFGTFLLLRTLGVGFWAGLLAAVCFMVTPHLVSMGVFGHGSKLASVALLPWMLWAALHVRQAARPYVWTAVLALVLGLQFLRGHPQIAFYGVLMLALWVVVEIVASTRRPAARRPALAFAARLALAGVLAVGLSAVLLLPVRAYAPESIRGAVGEGAASYDYATAWSQSPREVLTFAVPSALGFGEATYVGHMPFTNYPHYLGQAALLFATAALVLLRGRWIAFLACLMGVSLLVSFGRHVPLVYDVFYDYLPYFDHFRVPVMILVLFQLATSILAGLGCAALFGVKPARVEWRHAPSVRTVRQVLIVAAVGAAMVLLATLPWADSLAARVAASPRLPASARQPYADIARGLLQGDGLRVGLLLALNAVLVFAAWKRRLPVDVAGAALVVVLLFDLGVVDRRMVRPEKTWPGVPVRVVEPRPPRTPTPLFEFLRAQGSGAAPPRVLPTGELFQSNEWMSYGIASVGGYHPAKLSRYQALYAADALSRPRVLDMLGVQFFVSSQPLAEMGDPVYRGPEGVVYANPSAYPRAWLVGGWRQVEPQACVSALLDRGFQPRVEALVESPPGLAPDSAAPVGRATIQTFSANRVELAVESSSAALLVLSEAYHPGWRVWVNDEPGRVLAADCALRAVVVPAGTSRVRFEFHDPALRAGLGISLGALVAIVLLFLLGLRRGAPAAHAPVKSPAEDGS